MKKIITVGTDQRTDQRGFLKKPEFTISKLW